MQISEKRKISNNILYAKKTLLLEYEKVYFYGQPKNSKKILLKYFPKFIRQILMEDKMGELDGKTITKLKRVKILHKLTFSDQRTENHLWRVLFANKAKTTPDFYATSGLKQILQEIRFFPSIQEISFYGDDDVKPVYRISQHLQGMRKLKSIHIELQTEDSLKILMRIELYPRLLKSLEKFSISFKKWPEFEDQELLEIIFDFYLLNYVSKLEFGILGPDGIKNFKRLPAACPNLKCISLVTWNWSRFWECDDREGEDLKEFEIFARPYREASDYLQTLGAFQKLERIQISVGNLFTFIRDFTLPSCI